jgi:hypothetical protein
MPSDGKSTHYLWQGELKSMITPSEVVQETNMPF